MGYSLVRIARDSARSGGVSPLRGYESSFASDPGAHAAWLLPAAARRLINRQAARWMGPCRFSDSTFFTIQQAGWGRVGFRSGFSRATFFTIHARWMGPPLLPRRGRSMGRMERSGTGRPCLCRRCRLPRGAGDSSCPGCVRRHAGGRGTRCPREPWCPKASHASREGVTPGLAGAEIGRPALARFVAGPRSSD